MPNAKKPIHEALSFRLAVAMVGMDSDPVSAKASQVALILSVLQESKMKAKDAHEIAMAHHELPDHLRTAGQTQLADLAVTALGDLKGRQDEPKKQEQPTKLFRESPPEAGVNTPFE